MAVSRTIKDLIVLGLHVLYLPRGICPVCDHRWRLSARNPGYAGVSQQPSARLTRRVDDGGCNLCDPLGHLGRMAQVAEPADHPAHWTPS